MAPMLYHRCLARLNNDRIADLKGIAVYDPEDDQQRYSRGAATRTPVTSNQDTTQPLWQRASLSYSFLVVKPEVSNAQIV